MANTISPIYAKSEELNILYNFKKYVQGYREGILFGNLNKILEEYPKVVNIAETNPSIKMTRNQIFDNLMRPLKNALIEMSVKRSELGDVTIPSDLLPLFDSEKVADFQKVVAALNQNIQREKELSTPVKKKASTQSVRQEKEDLFFRLKQEAIAYLNSPKCSYSQAEKEKYIKIVETTESMEIEHNSGSVKININGLPKKILFGIRFKDKKGNVSNPQLSTSTYGMLSKEDIAALSKISKNKTKTLESSVVVADKKSKIRADKNAEKEEANRKTELDGLPAAREELKKELDKAFNAILLSADSEELFNILASDNSLGKQLSAWLRPKTDSVSLQDALHHQTAKVCVYNPVVWSLYQKKDKDNQYAQSYYDTLLTTICGNNTFKDDMAEIFEKTDPSDEIKKTIDKIASVGIEREIAQEIFLQKVFEYGVSMYSSPFSPERFDKMNQILEPFGYRIAMRPFVAERECSEAKPVSDKVIDEMKHKQKVFRNKELALLYHIGEAISGDKPYKFDHYNLGNNKEYEHFAALHYGILDEKKAKSNQSCRSDWEKFIGNAENMRIAKEVYKTLSALTDNKNAKNKMIEAMMAGRTNLEDILPLASESVHHNMERKYAGLLETIQGIEEYSSVLNADELLTSTFSAHPADEDPHRLAHLFDTRGMYIYMHDGQYKTGTISGIKKGDVVFAPIVEVKRNGRFEPAISRGTFLITSHAGEISAPEVFGKNRKSSRFKECIVNMTKDAPKVVAKLTTIFQNNLQQMISKKSAIKQS